MKQFLFFILFLQISFSSFAQVLDADRADNVDTLSKKLNCIIGLNGSADKQKKNLVDGSTVIDLTYALPKKHILIFKGNSDFTTNGNEFLQNSGYLHLRYRDDDTRKFSSEYFLQYQWNGLLGMKSRELAGYNYRWMVLDNSIKNDLFLGLGLMYENENWNYKGVNSSVDYSMYNDTSVTKIRINQYIKSAFFINENVDIVLTNFIQSDLKNISKPRISTNAAFNFEMLKHLGLSLNFESMYDFKPVVPIDKFIYSIKLQLNIKL